MNRPRPSTLLDRLGAGDRQAARQLLERAHGRLRRLAARILNESFPLLKPVHDVDSIVDEAWIRLAQALEKMEPPTVADCVAGRAASLAVAAQRVS
jgi:DNA-directed RNA polymerase specialized sigma24 family protein